MSQELNRVDTILYVPRGSLDANSQPIALDMTSIYDAERRLAETEHANVYTANALSAVFNMASCQTAMYTKKVSYELSKAKTLLKKRESELLLDEWPVYMAERKLNDSAAMRSAFLIRDISYSTILDKIDLLTAIEALLKDKKDVFVRAYQQMKQLYASEKRDPTYCKPESNGD